MNTGGYYKAGKRYVLAVMIGGPYDWKDAIRLKLPDSEIITTKDKFVTEKPVSEFQRRRNEKHAERAECVAKILKALADGRWHTAREIADATGLSPQAIYGRVCAWSEFEAVKINDNVYHLAK
jgi:hypothetical protein